MRAKRRIAGACVVALVVFIGGTPPAGAHPDTAVCPSSGVFFHHCDFFSVGTGPGGGTDRVAQFKHVTSTGDRTALIDIETGDSHVWRLGVSGTGNGLSLAPGTFYLEKQGVGVGLRIQPTSVPNIIGGPIGNIVTAGAVGATISGGGGGGANGNLVTDNFGTVGGGQGNVAGNPGADVAEAGFPTVGGGVLNNARAAVATIGGGTENLASGFASTIGGGSGNNAGGFQATVGGGGGNFASFQQSTIGGGVNNSVGLIGTVGGGASNGASGTGASVGGGQFNGASDDYSTIAGGFDNLAGDGPESTVNRAYAFVGGGQTNEAQGTHSTIGGGNANTITATAALIGGGSSNDSTDAHGVVAGGFDNQAGDNAGTAGDKPFATVGGGALNKATGGHATVPGGRSNLASGQFSFAAGRAAQAVHDGSFVWADSTAASFASSAPDEFNVRAVGGTRIFSGVSPASGVVLAPGDGAWGSLSDRRAKTNFTNVDSYDVLQALMTVPISTWSYKAQGSSVRHIGPMSQDFFAAFGVGSDDRHITTVDADGVALASIQALYELVQAQAERIKALERAGGE